MQDIKKLTTTQAMNLLKQDGIIVSEKQAEEMTQFLYFLGDVLIDQYIKSQKNEKKGINSDDEQSKSTDTPEPPT